MKKFKEQGIKHKLSIVMAVIFFLGLIPVKNLIATATETLGPVVNPDGTVTISYQYDGDELYINGDFTGWNFQKMTKGEDNIFSYTTEVLGVGSYGYKFSPEAAWGNDFNQDGETGGAPNSSFEIKALGATLNGDGTATFRVKYDGDELYLVGGMNNWTEAIPMTKGTDGVFETTIDVEEGKTYEYKYKVTADMSDWSTGSFNQDGGESNSSLKVPGKVIAYAPVFNGDGTVTLSYADISASSVYLAGDFVNEVWNPTGLAMTNNGEGLWTITIGQNELSKYSTGDQVQYKFVVNGTQWVTDPSNTEIANGNSVFTYQKFDSASAPVLNGDGTVVFSFKDDSASSVSVAGDMNGWDSTATPMTKNEFGVWTAVFEPAEGTTQIVYKYVVDGSNWLQDPNALDSIGDGFGGSNSVFNLTGQVVEHKKVILKYVREDGNYDGWCLWNWSTGLKEGQVDFEVKDGVAVATFDVSDDCKSVGFKVMKDNWAQVDVDSDRYIEVDPNAMVTKVVVTSGQLDMFVVPQVKELEINPGRFDFEFRDNDLYNKDSQENVESVKVVVTYEDGTVKEVPMEYDSKNEYFTGSYLNDNMKEGIYSYKFVEVVDGEEKVSEEKTFEYKVRDISVKASVDPYNVTSKDNAVVSVELTGKNIDKDSIRKVYMDLSSVGGKEETKMDLSLLDNGKFRQTIAITDSTTAGVKTIPVVIVDVNGQEHKTTFEINVKTKVSSGSNLDFDFDEASIYQILTDRFLNGNTSNDDPNGNNYDKTAPYTYHGGDFAGITQKIKDGYLTDLGINTIWISPIVENTDVSQGYEEDGGQYSYHGYWAKDFTLLDPHWGTMEEFKELIDVAHENGIKIMVDVVLNHSGYGTEALFGDMLRSEDGGDIYTNASSGLPDFRTEDPAVRAKLIAWQLDWLNKAKTEKGNTIDYFRVDTVKHVEDATWKELKSELTKANTQFKMIGEFYGADYNTDGGQLQSGQMDALLDFSYKNYATNFVNGKVEDTSKTLDERASKLNNSYLLGQFLSSHDEDGFLTRVDNNLGKQMAAASLQITDKGIPVVYYGEELGMTGLNGMENKDGNRYDMDFSKATEDNVVYNHYKKLLNTRERYLSVFAKGDRKTLAGSDEEQFSAFERNYNGHTLLTLINVSDEANNVTVKTSFKEGEVLVDAYNNDKEYVVLKAGEVAIELAGMQEGGTAILAPKGLDEELDKEDDNNKDNPSIDDDNKEDDNNNSSNNNGNSSNNNGTTSNGNGTKTGDSNTGIVVFVSIMFLSAGLIVFLRKKRA